MKMFYSKQTGGFYNTDIHGPRTMLISDPNWTAPKDDPKALPPLVEAVNPHCLIPVDAVEITTEEHAALIEGQALGKVIVADKSGRPILKDPPPPTAEQIMSRLEARVQQWLDEQARALGYDDIKSAVTYAEESAVPKFQQEGQAMRRLRSMAWARCYEILSEVQAGQRSIPTEAELIAEMEALK